MLIDVLQNESASHGDRGAKVVVSNFCILCPSTILYAHMCELRLGNAYPSRMCAYNCGESNLNYIRVYSKSVMCAMSA